jgi:N-acetylmuramoyl-L-alanine amidase
MNIIQKYLPTNTKRRSGLLISGIKFGVAHDTGNLNSTALQNVDYYIKSANELEASAHAFVDDTGVIECIPFTEKAYHVRRIIDVDNKTYGFDAIDYALGIELCYFDDIERSKKSYNNYVEYWSSLCSKYNLNPAKDLIGHYKLDPTRRTDPLNAFKRINKTWDDFITDVSAHSKPIQSKDILIKYISDVETTVGKLKALINEL